MTGLLYLIVIGMWAAVLLPIFLKKYDQTQLNKSVGIGDEIRTWRLQPKAESTARQQAFVRRRRVVMALLTAFVLSLLAGLSGLIAGYWALVPAVLLALFVYVAIRQGHKLSSQPVAVQSPSMSLHFSEQTTVAVILDEPIVASQEDSVVANTWVPVEPPVPAYVKAAKASAIPRAIDSQKPWTGQDMVEHAAKLKAEQVQRRQEATKRLEEARALAMEKARRAALAVRPVSAAKDEEITPKVVGQ